jgi:hypothetical protein
MRLVDAASATRACSTIVSIWSSALIRLDTPDTVGPDLHGVLAFPSAAEIVEPQRAARPPKD